jgi:hypothetical protein
MIPMFMKECRVLQTFHASALENEVLNFEFWQKVTAIKIYNNKLNLHKKLYLSNTTRHDNVNWKSK